MSTIKPHSIADRIRLFFGGLEKWAIAMDDASPTNALFERFRALEARVALLIINNEEISAALAAEKSRGQSRAPSTTPSQSVESQLAA